MKASNADEASSMRVTISGRTELTFNILAVSAAALAALLPLGVVTYWLLATPISIAHSASLSELVVGDPGLVQRLYATLLTLPAFMPLSWGLLRLRVCFNEFGRGRPFSTAGIRGLRDFAAGTGLSAMGKVLSTALLSVYLSWSQPVGQRMLAVTVDSDTLLLVVFASVITAVSWAMDKAAVIAEEHSQFV